MMYDTMNDWHIITVVAPDAYWLDRYCQQVDLVNWYMLMNKQLTD
jgi:hypothetical protein